jgi:hypothetical protein
LGIRQQVNCLILIYILEDMIYHYLYLYVYILYNEI